MNIATLRGAIQAQPFRPFVLHTSSGRAIRVPHPDFIAHSATATTVEVIKDRWGFEAVDLLLISNLETEPARAPGGRRRRS
jgi:hypothetical protein